MIVWSGLGFIVAVIGFGSLLLTEVISENMTHNESFYQENPWVMSLGMLVAAALTFGYSLTVGQGRTQDSFFFIPTKWWPVIFAGIAIVCLFR